MFNPTLLLLCQKQVISLRLYELARLLWFWRHLQQSFINRKLLELITVEDGLKIIAHMPLLNFFGK